ncbi:PEP/pyruvate-binding domain-containing protein [Streptomyces sp. NBRC 109706]|uniref:PEP/pyruvate-binding domain-containing protein n=1 Tax=Streptomyces sp. NBRC 109706 TaxID=1550035 RepID=UPI0008327776|nr:PEP/pyruvate-binding domain-containing protein [Streptomyces sp. NBRC 109706]
MARSADQLAVVALDTAPARDPKVVGGKAAHLSRAHASGLPVLPGFVLVAPELAPAGAPRGADQIQRACAELDAPALVVRSSAVGEDSEGSSMAGRFTSVLNVRGWPAFQDAVRRVLGSAADGPGGPGDPGGSAMAVLVQPMLTASVGGVLFGADPVAGRADRIVVSAVAGGPERLVDGSRQDVRYQLTRCGRLVGREPAKAPEARLLDRRRLRRLARLARRAERVANAPQDLEFGFDSTGRLWLFQTRPITAMAVAPARGARLLGPGPVAETFPTVLQPLEEDLWVVPMAHGLALALDIAGTVPRRVLRDCPAVLTVGGRAVADLRLLGTVGPPHPRLQFLNPAPGARRAAAAWRTGRLRTALPLLALDLMADVDRELAGLPEPSELLTGQLINALCWGRSALVALHAQESLAGALLPEGKGPTATGEALALLSERRAREARQPPDDAHLIAEHPVLLALLPPSLTPGARLPEVARLTAAPRGVAALPPREGLRLRSRWVQEMQARLVRECAARWEEAGHGNALARAAALRWPELLAALDGGGPPEGDPVEPRPWIPALPTAFRLSPRGEPVPERLGAPDDGEPAGEGASGGFGTGVAWDGTGEPPTRAVLVVRSLDPAFAPRLPGLAGLVAESGSALSHLAVLAREYRVPAAVGVPDAVDRFPPGTELSVDGTTGTVSR